MIVESLAYAYVPQTRSAHKLVAHKHTIVRYIRSTKNCPEKRKQYPWACELVAHRLYV